MAIDAKEQELIEACVEASRKMDEARCEWVETDHKLQAYRKWDEAYHKWDKAGYKLWKYRVSKAQRTTRQTIHPGRNIWQWMLKNRN